MTVQLSPSLPCSNPQHPVAVSVGRGRRSYGPAATHGTPWRSRGISPCPCQYGTRGRNFRYPDVCWNCHKTSFISVISRSNGRGASQSAHTPASSAPSSTAPQAPARPVRYVGYLLYSVAATFDSLGNQSTAKLNPGMTAEHISTRQIIQDQFCQMRTYMYVHIGHT